MFLIDWFYPKICFGCQNDLSQSENYFLCYGCWRSLKINNGVCLRCGTSLGILRGINCFACRRKTFLFKQLRCVGNYQGLLKELLLDFKFANKTQLTYFLGDLIVRQINKFPFPEKIDFVIPVPMHTIKKWQRGYNQSALIASHISTKIKCDYFENNLYKHKNTPPQSTLSLEKRKQNLKNAFAVSRPNILKQKTILLVDDIYTSGNTIIQCCQTLKKEANVGNIYVAVVAKGQ